jgi:hypothetical protein
MAKTMNNQLNNQSGAALVIALIMMVVLTLIGLASIFTSTFENKLSGNKRESTGAFFVADAGLEAAKANMTNFDPEINYVAAAGIPSELSSEPIDLVHSGSPNFNWPPGQTFVVPPTVTIYHLRVPGEGTQFYRSDGYIIASIGRDQLTALSLFGSKCEVREKRLLRSRGPLSEMEN